MIKKLENMSPKSLFIGGIVGGILLVSTIGFFIMLWVMFGSGMHNDYDHMGYDDVESNFGNNIVEKTAPVVEQNNEISLVAVNKDDNLRGDKNAPITIVEYSDTECPFCKRFHNTMKEVLQKYDGKVNWVYRHAPLDSLHKKSRKEAEASECAGEQGKFWEYIDRLFEITPSNDRLEVDQLPKIAKDVGLNTVTFNNCLDSGKYSKKVQQQLDDATKAGLRGTPYSVMIKGDKKVPISGAYPFSQLKTMIDQLLK